MVPCDDVTRVHLCTGEMRVSHLGYRYILSMVKPKLALSHAYINFMHYVTDRYMYVALTNYTLSNTHSLYVTITAYTLSMLP